MCTFVLPYDCNLDNNNNNRLMAFVPGQLE